MGAAQTTDIIITDGEYSAAFAPYTKILFSVTEEIQEIRIRYRVPLDQIGIKLLSIKTNYKNSNGEWIERDGLIGGRINEQDMCSSEFELFQEYEVSFFHDLESSVDNTGFIIAANKRRTFVAAVFEQVHKIKYRDGIESCIKEAIVRKLLMNGFAIGIWGEDIDIEIAKIVQMIRHNLGDGRKYRVPLLRAYDPVEPIDANLIIHHVDTVSYKNMADGVDEGALLFEYISPIRGNNGCDCFGNTIAVREPITEPDDIAIDAETIQRVEENGNAKYYSRISGCLMCDNGVYRIENEIQLESASYRGGAIEAGSDKDVRLMIGSGNKHHVDAVGTGVNIDIKSVKIDGTVGSNTSIQAVDVNIGSQTHKRSRITAEDVATIKLHRGSLKAKEAHIGVLESGSVEADTVHVDKMIGGEIIAREVYIKTLYSNAKITAEVLIEIDVLAGDGNNLVINPMAVASFSNKLKAIRSTLEREEATAEKHRDELEYKLQCIKRTKESALHSMGRIALAKKEKRRSASADIAILNRYKDEVGSAEVIRQRIKSAEDNVSFTKERIEELCNADTEAKVVLKTKSVGRSNTAVFIDCKTQDKYLFSPGNKSGIVRLEMLGGSKRVIFTPYL